jgi:hypothetical protein
MVSIFTLKTDAFIIDRRVYFIVALEPFMNSIRACFGTSPAVDTGIRPGNFIFWHLMLKPGWGFFQIY